MKTLFETKGLFLNFALISVFLIADNVRADLLTGGTAMNTTATIISGVNGASSVYVSPMRVNNLTTDQFGFLLFCGDFDVHTTAAFGNGTGQEYGAFAMSSPSVSIYSQLQKTYIDSLFGHAYATAFDLDGNILNTVYAQAIQLAIWSILHEETDNYNILEGSFHLATNYNTNVVNTTNSLLDAVLGYTTWKSLGLADYYDYDLTVYIAEGGNHVSQTLISVTGTPNREPDPTPEPATLAMLGLGLVGLGLARARRRRK